MLCTMLDTCATGTCVMAPAELLYVEDVYKRQPLSCHVSASALQSATGVPSARRQTRASW